MHSPNQPVTPTPFEAPAPAAPLPGESGASAKGLSPWLPIGLVTLLLAAVGVFIWLPGQVQPVEPPPSDRIAAAPATDASPDAAATRERSGPAPGADAAPWEESLRAKMRQQAQTVLEPLLDRQFELEKLGVTSWAPQAFNDALALAGAGDELYRRREFDAATAHYRDALSALDAILASIPERRGQLLDAAVAALEVLDQASALRALDTVDTMSPGTPDSSELRERAALQPSLVDAFNLAAAAESLGHLAEAKEAMARATAIDPAHRAAGDELDRITEALKSQQYRDAMSRGYVALADNQLAEARAAFLENVRF